MQQERHMIHVAVVKTLYVGNKTSKCPLKFHLLLPSCISGSITLVGGGPEDSCKKSEFYNYHNRIFIIYNYKQIIKIFSILAHVLASTLLPSGASLICKQLNICIQS